MLEGREKTEQLETEERLKRMVAPLLEWYRKEHRILPWRESKNPYYIWISEIMLQQTRVEAVKPFFQRFIEALPDVKAVAACPEEQLLKLWEGLGYYNRVRNIQKAAVQIVEQYEGEMPGDYEKLLKLPGIGSYTAGAVASIAFGIPVPAVDGNVLRVYSRLTECRDDILKQSVKKRVEKELLAVMPEEEPGNLNQALMELGAMVCVPNGMAKCEQCPVAALCMARNEGTIMELPVKKKPKARRIEQKTVLIIRDGQRVAIHKRPGKGLLAGLYELPNLEGYQEEEPVLSWVRSYGLEPLRIQKLAPSRHIFSHVEWEMRGYMVRVAALEEEKQRDLLFVETEDVERSYPVPAAFGAYAAYMNMRLGQEKYNQEELLG